MDGRRMRRVKLPPLKAACSSAIKGKVDRKWGELPVPVLSKFRSELGDSDTTISPPKPNKQVWIEYGIRSDAYGSMGFAADGSSACQISFDVRSPRGSLTSPAGAKYAFRLSSYLH